MSQTKYQQTHRSATKPVTNSKRKDLPIWERFLARAWELQAQGKAYDHWRRAAFILWNIENDQPVGHWRAEGKGAGV